MIAADSATGARATLASRAADLLRASFGVEIRARDGARWGALHPLAVEQRLAPLVWLRTGQRIAAESPADAHRWRVAYLSAMANAHALLRVQAELRDRLRHAGVHPVVLKGAPLAVRLHGDVATRVSDDVDLFVAPSERATASRALRDAGWERDGGEAPDDEMFRRHDGERIVRVEVHSTLAPARLGHLPVPAPGSVPVTIDGVTLDAFAGPLLAGYLAGHLATHNFPPLLWWVDFTVLWRALAEPDRRAAREAAEGAGLGGYLSWAARRADAVSRVLAGDDRAMRALGFHGDDRIEPHQLWRHVAAARSLGSATRVVGAWARPAWAPERDGGPVAGTLRRLSRHWRLLAPLRERRPASEPAPAGTVRTLTGEQILAVAREVIAAKGEFWLPLTGESMTPTLRRGDRILLGPPRLRRGAIVLADIGGRPVVHRLLRTGPLVQTRGDACRLCDPPVEPSRVLATVIASERGGRLAVHWPTRRFGMGAVARGVIALARLATSRLRRLARGPELPRVDELVR